MSETNPLDLVRIESIFHPSDFSEASEVAFVHALKMALVTQSKLRMLHASAHPNVDWQDFPGVRATLERWHLIPKDSPRSAVADLGIEVKKVVAVNEDPVRACLSFLARHPTDLIVLAVHQHEGRMRWLRTHVGEPIARGSGQIALFIPHGVDGFVSLQDGSVSLRNMLIPIASTPRPQPAVEAATRLIRGLRLPSGTVTLLHVGSGDGATVKVPDDTGWSWNRVNEEGEPAEVILRTAGSLAADLILMTTDGPDGFLDGLRGSTSERVLRKARCPVANLPAGSMLG
jgi:nucleotide-binding universal stress UspA family protein